MHPATLLRALLVVASVGLTPAAAEVVAAHPTPASATRYAGRPLEEALLDLRRQGLRIAFTSRFVRPELIVETEPTATEPRQILDELLAPHGLVARAGPGGTLMVLPGEGEGSATESSLAAFEDELVVTPSRISLLRDEPVAFFGFTRDEIQTLPRLGDDFFRSLSLLPGTAANDVTAQFHVRGGRRDEAQIVLDGQELYEPFHLRDFDNALSVVSAETLSHADLLTGGFPVQYGDRMSGVLDMTTKTPSGSPRFRVGAGTAGGNLGGSGSLHDGGGSWLVEARRGSTDLIGRLLEQEDPRYWDVFGKLTHRFGTAHSLRANVLHSADQLAFAQADEEESDRLHTEYDSAYAWLTQQTALGDRLAFETAGSWARIDRRRRGDQVEEDADFSVVDDRETHVLGLRQSWNFEASPKHSLAFGWQVRRFDADYDYFGTARFGTPLARIRHNPDGDPTLFRGRFEATHQSAYLADRVRLSEPLTVELGLRYDRHTQTGERPVSPRLNLAYALSERSVVRLAWGRFNQSQRPYEVQVEDGESGLHPVERSEHRVLGFEQIFDVGDASPPLVLRLEVYQREVFNPRPRYESLFEPLNPFPEMEPDRVRITPERSVAQGFEVFLRGGLGSKLGWWVNYAYASTEDSIDGRWVPRLFDARHSVNLDVDYRVNERWRLNCAWRYHTGWPTTPLLAVPAAEVGEESGFVPVLGPLNSERLSTHHRLDLRVSRQWPSRLGTIAVFLDVQNAYDRENLGGFDYELDEETGSTQADEVRWPGVLPSIGVSLEF